MHGMGGLVAIAALLQTPHRAPTLGRCPCVAPQAALPVPGQPAPILLYFGTQLDKGKLNAIESLALAKLVIPQRKQALLQKWISEEKLECTQVRTRSLEFVDCSLHIFHCPHPPAVERVSPRTCLPCHLSVPAGARRSHQDCGRGAGAKDLPARHS